MWTSRRDDVVNDKNRSEPPEEKTSEPPESGKASRTSRFFALVDDAENRRLPRGLLVVCFSLLTVVLLVMIFQQLAGILQPLFIAAFIGYLIMPVHRFLIACRIPSVFSYVTIVMLLVVMIFGFVRITYTSAVTMKENSDIYTERIDETFEYFSAKFDGFIDLINQMKPGAVKENPGVGEPVAPAAAKSAAPAAEPEETDDRDAAADLISREWFQGRILPALLGSVSVLVTMLVVLVYLAFLLAEAETIDRRVRRIFGGDRGGEVLEVIGQINRAISKYIAVKTSINLLTGVLTSTVLLIFGVDFAIFWGVVAFLFNYIPYVGSVVAVVPPILLAFLQFGFCWQLGAVAVGLLAIQNVIGYVIEPRMTGRQLDLSPLMVLLALAFWGWMWGIVGMILAVPIVVSLKIIFDHIPATKPIAGLMSDLPPPEET